MKRITSLGLILALIFAGCGKEVEEGSNSDVSTKTTKAKAATVYEGEDHLKNLRQLTFGGQNAEAYFSHDGSELIFQSTRDSLGCDAIFRMNIDGSNVRMISSGKGTTTCSFIAPDGRSIIYSSTHLSGEDCPPKPDYSMGYVWPLYDSYDIFTAKPDGSDLVRITNTDGYDAEAVYSADGQKILFTSTRTGDLELFMMKPDGSDVEQLTDIPGYDGGSFFSYDGEWIVWRASRPEGKELKEYKDLLEQGLIKPGHLELYIMNLEKGEPIQVTENGAANFGPYWHPDGKHLIYASNVDDPEGRDFNLYLLNIESRETIQITNYDSFDGFPMFSHDGKKLVFASNRDGKERGETNIFIADWVW